MGRKGGPGAQAAGRATPGGGKPAAKTAAPQRAGNRRSRFLGVGVDDRKEKRWAAQVYHSQGGKKRKQHIAMFAREEDAARAYDRVSIAFLGHAKAQTNFPVEEYRAEWAELEALGLGGAVALERERERAAGGKDGGPARKRPKAKTATPAPKRVAPRAGGTQQAPKPAVAPQGGRGKKKVKAGKTPTAKKKAAAKKATSVKGGVQTKKKTASKKKKASSVAKAAPSDAGMLKSLFGWITGGGLLKKWW